jgi:fructose-1,6-bisphosphatase/inositol monophosphatase family enzyme
VRDQEILDTLLEAAVAVENALSGFEGSGLSGRRPTQYLLDEVADRAAISVLLEAGFAVFSEETGLQGQGDLTVVIDPVDGSTNCDRGIPFFCTSLAVIDDEGLRAGLVRSLVSGVTYTASRGGGAFRDGQPIAPSSQKDLREAIVGVNGLYPKQFLWRQTRSMGAAALEMCLVADGSLDAFFQAPPACVHPWDYLAAMLICQEAGAIVRAINDEALVLIEAIARHPIMAATRELADAIESELANSR